MMPICGQSVCRWLSHKPARSTTIFLSSHIRSLHIGQYQITWLADRSKCWCKTCYMLQNSSWVKRSLAPSSLHYLCSLKVKESKVVPYSITSIGYTITVNPFKNCLDNYWSNQNVLCDYRADLHHIGNHCIVTQLFYSTVSNIKCILILFLGYTGRGGLVPFSPCDMMWCAQSWSRFLGSQPTGNVSHKPGGRLPLLSTRPVVTFPVK